MKVLMICTGNICRSPTAEAVLRSKLAAAGLGRRVQVDSAGLEGYHVGDPPDRRAQRHAATRGYDLSGQVARRLHEADFERFDWVLAMDLGHLRELQRQCPPEFGARVRLLMDFSDTPGTEVPDPYYGNAAGFELVLDLVERGCDGLVSSLRAR
ncbi:MAG TPA: low molecular weight protein-tyrosine-phosphatase [Ideonella sp.]|nr:low molecular weight protein-tyrosine-phosphatase [Ideonella sp.]